MLNRRILRVKVMQNLFAWHINVNAEVERQKNLLEDTFAQDLLLENYMRLLEVNEKLKTSDLDLSKVNDLKEVIRLKRDKAVSIYQANAHPNHVPALQLVDADEMDELVRNFAEQKVNKIIEDKAAEWARELEKAEEEYSDEELTEQVELVEPEPITEADRIEMVNELIKRLTNRGYDKEINDRIHECLKDLVQEAKSITYLAPQRFLNSVAEVYKLYLKALKMTIQMPVELELEESDRIELSLLNKTAQPEYKMKLVFNPVLKKIHDSTDLVKEYIAHSLENFPPRELSKSLYRNDLTQRPEYKEYRDAKTAELEDHLAMALFIAKEIVLKSEIAVSMFEQDDLFWSTNRDVIKSMLSKTIKSAAVDADVKPAIVSRDYKGDTEFAKDLMKQAMTHFEEYEGIIGAHTQNWDASRITLTDKMVLLMGVTELIHCPNINPVTTIDEYVEVAKAFSTPESGSFVNGVLDAIYKSLDAEGKIKKSAIGLIRN